MEKVKDKNGVELQVGDVVRTPLDPESQIGGTGWVHRISGDAALVNDCPYPNPGDVCGYVWARWCRSPEVEFVHRPTPPPDAARATVKPDLTVDAARAVAEAARGALKCLESMVLSAQRRAVRERLAEALATYDAAANGGKAR